jgi:hypothetical protein
MQFANWDAGRRHFVLDDRPPQYEIPAAANQVRGRFVLPNELRHGRYLLALAILDPAGEVPSCRFAIENYFTGGRHPLGRVGDGREVERAELDSSKFSDLALDTTIGYQLG